MEDKVLVCASMCVVLYLLVDRLRLPIKSYIMHVHVDITVLSSILKTLIHLRLDHAYDWWNLWNLWTYWFLFDGHSDHLAHLSFSACISISRFVSSLSALPGMSRARCMTASLTSQTILTMCPTTGSTLNSTPCSNLWLWCFWWFWCDHRMCSKETRAKWRNRPGDMVRIDVRP